MNAKTIRRVMPGPYGLRAIAFAVILLAGSIALPAGAQEPQRATKAQANVLQLNEITIVGRVQKPVAAVDVAKIQPKLTLSELTKTFVGRIEKAALKDPF
jgi:hypothetical protein